MRFFDFHVLRGFFEVIFEVFGAKRRKPPKTVFLGFFCSFGRFFEDFFEVFRFGSFERFFLRFYVRRNFEVFFEVLPKP